MHDVPCLSPGWRSTEGQGMLPNCNKQHTLNLACSERSPALRLRIDLCTPGSNRRDVGRTSAVHSTESKGKSSCNRETFSTSGGVCSKHGKAHLARTYAENIRRTYPDVHGVVCRRQDADRQTKNSRYRIPCDAICRNRTHRIPGGCTSLYSATVEPPCAAPPV